MELKRSKSEILADVVAFTAVYRAAAAALSGVKLAERGTNLGFYAAAMDAVETQYLRNVYEAIVDESAVDRTFAMDGYSFALHVDHHPDDLAAMAFNIQRQVTK